MAENDVYNSKGRYEHFKKNLDLLLIPAEKRQDKQGNHCKYYCKNKANLKYFKRLFELFAAKDISYIRRIRVCDSSRLVVCATCKDLAEIDKRGDRKEINKIVAFMHQNYKSQNIE